MRPMEAGSILGQYVKIAPETARPHSLTWTALKCLDLVEELGAGAFPRFARCLEQFQQDMAKSSHGRYRR